MNELLIAAESVNAWWSGFIQNNKDTKGTYTAEIFEKLRTAVYHARSNEELEGAK